MHSDHTSQKSNLNHPDYFNNREISWLAFNKRVLQEAIDERNPLLERLKFISIFSTNLDEFFMVRVAGLKDQVKAGYNKRDSKSGLTPSMQLNKISQYCHHLVQLQDELFSESLKPTLKEQGIEFLTYKEITHDQHSYLSNLFDDYILPVLTPLAIDASRPFPKLMNKSLNLAVVLTTQEDSHTNKKLAFVQVPSVIDRVISLPSSFENERCYIFLEEVMSIFIHRLFQGNKILSISQFRITRNADLWIDEEDAEDLLKEIEKELQKRKWGATVRLEILENTMDTDIKYFLKDRLDLKEEDIYFRNGLIDYSFLSDFCHEIEEKYSHLFNDPIEPQSPLKTLNGDETFETILKKDLFFHHPYHSFQPIVDLLKTAAEDEQVLAIKQTLYRVSGNSPIIQALARAAKNGKQVTALVELKARFDEESNIRWAKMLEQAGVHVIYGVAGLKTHSKITLVIRLQEDGKIRRFVHLGTGNYNDKTARLYTDMGILTARESFGIDATNFFNHLSGYSHKPYYKEIITAPNDLREYFLQLIDEEIKHKKEFGYGRIIAKMNSLTDKPIILKLYEASNAGVKIDLIVRGVCCLRPGIKGVSENIAVRSIVDRFLEHSRIFYFYQNGKESTFLSSADWMMRNMDRRIEILFPLHDQDIKRTVIDVLKLTLADNIKARLQQSSGEYHYAELKSEDQHIQSQKILCLQAANKNSIVKEILQR